MTVSGVYIFQLSASDTKLTSASTVTVTVQAADANNKPPVVNASSSQTIQLPTNSLTLNGTATDDGLPAGATLTVLWKQLSGPSTVTFANPNLPVTQAIFSAAGSYVVQLSASDTEFTSTSAIVITVLPADVPPVVSAGANQAIELPTSQAVLNGSVTDTTLPPNATLSVAWSELSGPATANLGTPSNAVTLANFSTPGTYLFQLLATDGTLSSASTTTVTVYPVNQAPVVNAGGSKSFIYIPYMQKSINLSGVATDDGYPSGSTLAIQWTEISVPAPVTFSNPNTAATTANFVAGGAYVLQLSATDGQYTSVSGITVNAYPLTISTGAPYEAFVGVPIQIAGSITANGQDEEFAYPFQWLVEGNSGSVTAGAYGASTAERTFTFGGAGPYTMTLCLSVPGGCDTEPGLAQTFTLNVQPNPGSVAPSLAISSPTDGSEVTKPTPVIGTVATGNWALSYQAQNNYATEPLVRLASGSNPVTNATLGTIDPTMLLNGTYNLILTTTDPSSGATSSVTVPVSVTRNMKVGVFSLSFNDLTVPVAGVPIQIVRSYSSIDPGVGDFGWHDG